MGLVEPLSYRVRFENKSDASAPARQVIVTDTLNTDVDLSTLELTEITFANRILTIPTGKSRYAGQMPITVTNAFGTNSVLVAVQASVDEATRELRLSLSALDPNTGWFHEDPLVGLLYPNDDTGRGVGSISYLIRPRSGLPTGTRIENRARIVFDYNDPIDTPLVFNTIDAGEPTSSVSALPATSETNRFLVSWSGSDDAGGSGIADYDIYVSEDGGPFTAWLQREPAASALFSGVPGHAYAFYSVAWDNVGNEEAAPAVADASTTLTVPFTLDLGLGSLPDSILVGSNVSYTVSVSNTGPGDAAGVVLTHQLDNAFELVSAEALPGGTVGFTNGVITAQLGQIASGGQGSLLLTLTPQMAGTFTNHVEVTCDQGVASAIDVVATVTDVLQPPPPLTLELSATELLFTWPADATGFVLESADSLTPPVQWAPVTNAPVLVGDQQTLRLSPTNTTTFYRLRSE